MQISSSRQDFSRAKVDKPAPAEQSKPPAQQEAATPGDSVEIGYDKEAAKAEQSKLLGKSKVGGAIGLALGTAAGIAAGLVGGVAGTLVGLAVAPAGAVIGMVAGGVGGFMAVANRENTHVGHLIGGLALGALGAAALGTAGFYGGAALGAAAGGAGGALGALAGAIGGSTIGATLGGGGVAAYELSANKEQYPNLIAELKKEAAEEAEKKKKEEAETKELLAELKQKFKESVKS